MSSFTCEHCGITIDEGAQCCSVCGHLCRQDASNSGETDLQARQAHEFVELARHCQQDGDLITAIRYAREAQSLQPDSSAIHALLGYLYEQQGNHTAAQYHFQNALNITPGAAEAIPVLPPAMPTYAVQGRWMVFVLVGCIVFSGFAAVLTLWPEDYRHVGRGSIIQMPVAQQRRQPRKAPQWQWLVPEPMATKTGAASYSHTTKSASRVTIPDRSEGQQAASASATSQDESPVPVPDEVLGPSTRARVIAEPSAPTLEQADLAYFRGEYERAVIVYEAILQGEEAPHPRVHRDVAWCYQHLGNSSKAATHLMRAVHGYQQIVNDDPDNTAARQGLSSCQAALNTLLATQDTVSIP